MKYSHEIKYSFVLQPFLKVKLFIIVIIFGKLRL